MGFFLTVSFDYLFNLSHFKMICVKKTGLLIPLLASYCFATAQDDFKPYETMIKGSNVKFRMVPVPEGSFMMGSAATEKGRRPDEGPQQKVQLEAFWMGAHEVTYDEFLLFFEDESTSRNSDVDAVTRPTPQYIDLSWGMGKQGGFPVNSMSHRTALMYCRWLYQKTGVFYRLPTEAEWEYACRAGTSTAYYFGNDPKLLDQYAWHAGNSKNKYQKVGQKKPNAWGLYDMLGNVSEWTLDQYREDYFKTIGSGAVNPVIQPGNTYPKTVRGGGYTEKAPDLRAAARGKSDPSWNKRDPQIPKSKWWLTDAASVGFRLVRPLKQPTAKEAEAFYNQYIPPM
jgi:formylglycine-generating enzyme required for sulfatase activity